jgi:hypothetical protein
MEWYFATEPGVTEAPRERQLIERQRMVKGGYVRQ